jgi:Uncharacterized alpha/beta hydrolase domain (DUF2235)
MKTAKSDKDSGLTELDKKVKKLGSEKLAERHVRIKAIGIWDAVSALGFPIPLQVPQPKGKTFRAVHTLIPENADYCYQALALDEKRKHFQPVVWESQDSCPNRERMKQCWFVGGHGDVGGGKPDAVGLSNLSLVWMMAHLAKTGADFDEQTFSAFLNPDEVLCSELEKEGWDKSVHADFSAADQVKSRYEVHSYSLPPNLNVTRASPPHQPTEASTGASSVSESDIREKLSSEASGKRSIQQSKTRPLVRRKGQMLK